MGKKNIGATLSLNSGNFFSNIKSAVSATNTLKNALTNATGSMKTVGTQSVSMGNSLMSVGKKVVGVVSAYAGFNTAKDFLTDCVQGVMDLEKANKRLDTLMMNVKGTTKEQVQSIIDYADALETVTTIEGDATAAGASQLATFQLSGDTIKTLLPAFQDLAVAQYGTNVTQEQMIQSGNLLGKVMMGSTGALTKAGVSFTEAQEKILKTGTESQKAATLVEVLGANFGGLAEKMAQTPEGRILQLRNAWGSVKDEIGFAVLPAVSSFVSYTASKIPQMRDMVTNAIKSMGQPMLWIKDNILPPLKIGFKGVWNYGVSAFNNIKNAINSNGDGIENLKTVLNTVKDALFNAFEYSRPVLGWIKDSALPEIAGTFSNIIGVIKIVGDNWNWLSPIVYGVAGAVAAYNIAVSINNGLVAIAAITTGTSTSALGAMTIAQVAQTATTGIATVATTAFGAAMAFVTSPIFLVVAAIGAAIAIGVLLYQNWDTVCKGIGIAWQWVKDMAVNIWNGIANFFITYWPYILGIFTGGIGLVVGHVIQNWDSIKTKTAEIWNNIKETLSAFWTDLKEKFTSGIDSIKELWNNLKEFLKHPIQGTVKLFKKTDEDDSGVTINGSHKAGLASVPFDGYIAELHKNERVLTAEESKTYSSFVNMLTNKNSTQSNGVVNNVMSKSYKNSSLNSLFQQNNNKSSSSIVINGSHKAGLARVPFDGYIAKLHKDERVLTAEENKSYSQNSQVSTVKTDVTNHIYIYADGKSTDEIVDELVPKLKLALNNL